MICLLDEDDGLVVMWKMNHRGKGFCICWGSVFTDVNDVSK